MELLGRYYVQIKNAHIHWGERRKTASRKIRGNESYIAIPASYAYEYNIRKGDIYQCRYSSGHIEELKAAGSQSKRDFAKQFQGNGSLKVLSEWYETNSAKEGDYVVVSIFADKTIEIECIHKGDLKRLSEFNISGEKGKIQERDERKTSGLRLVSLCVRHGDKVHCDIRFFSDELNWNSSNPTTSLIIGANGSGKSFVLKILSEIFNAIDSQSALGQLKYSHYELVYTMNGKLVELQILNRQVFIHVDGEFLEKDISKILPSKVLAVSFMLNDKFPFKQANSMENSIYEYLGVRMTSNASWTSSMNNKLAETFLNLASDNKIWDFIDRLSEFLSIDKKISITCEMSESDFYAEDLGNKLKEYGEKILQQDDYRGDAVKKYTDDVYQELASFIGKLSNEKMYDDTSKGKILIGVSFDVKTSKDDVKRIASAYKHFKELSNLKVFRSMTLNLYKKGVKYSFDESSSGEKHIFYSFANIFNSIKENSVVLIDEPEISLHPNWQIKYISILKKVFADYKSCHFIIASHSHYMVSDLDPETSSLITVNVDDDGKHFETIDYSTYAWSAENILYNIFEVRTFRNYYFDMDVRALLDAVSNNKEEDRKRIRYLYDKLSKYILDEKDPLNRILDEAKEYINNVEFK